MATCVPNTLLSQGADFQRLTSRGLWMASAEMAREWAGSSQTPSQILADGIAFQKLDEQRLNICIAQLLCEINGTIA